MAEQGGGLTLEKKLGLLNGCGIIIGNMIIFEIFRFYPPTILYYSGSVGMSLIIWTMSGLYATLGALCYAELGTTFKVSGGDYVYIYEAFGPIPAFAQMWLTILVIHPTFQAFWAVGYAQILSHHLQGTLCQNCPDEYTENVIICLALACIFVITFINCVSIKVSLFINDAVMIVKVLALVAIISVGIYHIAENKRESEHFQNAFEGTSENVRVLLEAFYYGTFSYGRWNCLNFMTSEIVDPDRNLPLAIIISLPAVTLLYILTNVAYFAVLELDEISWSISVASDFASKFSSQVGSIVVPTVSAFSLLSALNGSILTGSRLVFAGAKKKQLPPFLALVHENLKTPVPAFILTSSITCLFIWKSEIQDLIQYLDLEITFTLQLAVMSLIYLRITRPQLERPFKLPLVLPILYVMLAPVFIYTSASPSKGGWKRIGIGLLITFSAVPTYLLFILWNWPLKRILKHFSEKVSSSLQKIFRLSPERTGEETIEISEMTSRI